MYIYIYVREMYVYIHIHIYTHICLEPLGKESARLLGATASILCKDPKRRPPNLVSIVQRSIVLYNMV